MYWMSQIIIVVFFFIAMVSDYTFIKILFFFLIFSILYFGRNSSSYILGLQLYVQKVLCSEGPMFRRFYVQKVLCSEGPMFRRFYVQKYLFRRSYV